MPEVTTYNCPATPDAEEDNVKNIPRDPKLITLANIERTVTA
jgi:hypothetical protein